jgi:hypothetical protein
MNERHYKVVHELAVQPVHISIILRIIRGFGFDGACQVEAVKKGLFVRGALGARKEHEMVAELEAFDLVRRVFVVIANGVYISLFPLFEDIFIVILEVTAEQSNMHEEHDGIEIAV